MQLKDNVGDITIETSRNTIGNNIVRISTNNKYEDLIIDLTIAEWNQIKDKIDKLFIAQERIKDLT